MNSFESIPSRTLPPEDPPIEVHRQEQKPADIPPLKEGDIPPLDTLESWDVVRPFQHDTSPKAET